MPQRRLHGCIRYLDLSQVLADVQNASAPPTATCTHHWLYAVADAATGDSAATTPSVSTVSTSQPTLAGVMRVQVFNDTTTGRRLCEFGPFAVNPASQKEGMGKTLLAVAERYAKEHAADFLHILVVNHRTDAMEWYRRQGFVATGDTVPFEGNFDVATVTRPCHFVVFEKLMRDGDGVVTGSAAAPNDGGVEEAAASKEKEKEKEKKGDESEAPSTEGDDAAAVTLKAAAEEYASYLTDQREHGWKD